MKGCRPLTDREVQVCLEALRRGPCPDRDRALFALGVSSGLRISELLSLTLGDVIQNGRFADRIAVARKNVKKKTEGRIVLFHPEVRALVEVWVNELCKNGHNSPDTPLFKSTGKPKAISRITAWRIFTAAFEVCEMTGKLGTHSMRKTLARRVYEGSGKDLMKTQKALGHSRITSTVSYLSFDEKDLDDILLKAWK